MQKLVSGYCPIHDCNETIEVNYFELSTCDSPTTSYEKSHYKCEKHGSGFCEEKPCPIFSNAPKAI